VSARHGDSKEIGVQRRSSIPKYPASAVKTAASFLTGTLAVFGLSVLAAQPAAASTQVCLSGSLVYDHADAEAGTAKPVVTSSARNADWELWGKTSARASSQKLASGMTDGAGAFNACYSASGALAEAHVRFVSTSAKGWRVVSNKKTQTSYTFDSGTSYDVSGARDLGTVKAPAKVRNAWHIVDTLNKLYAKRANPVSDCWTAHQATGSCDRLTFVWTAAPTPSGYWDYPATNFVIMSGSGPDSEHFILHEAGHWFHWQLYDHRFPVVTNCNPHYIEKSSSTTCAWTEGFADAVAAYTLGDYRYVWEDGSSYSFENDATTPHWDTGDTVQGRVSSSLLDLSAPDGPDGGSWDRTIALMTVNMSEDFREYFTVDRPAASPPLSTTGAAYDIISGHTITY